MLEQRITELTAAVTQLIAVMSNGQATAPAPQTAPAAMPPAPNFAVPTPQAPAQSWAPPPAAAPAGAPFNDQPGLFAYCQATYTANNALGPVMGQILQKMTPNGEASALQPNQYGEFYAAVEAAKNGK